MNGVTGHRDSAQGPLTGDSPAPLITIAIPAYNAASTIRGTLDSILAQDSPDWEVSVVDDGSTDETLALLREYEAREQRVVVTTQSNQGTGGALNTAFRNASGRFIAQFGADDQVVPNYISTMAAFMEEHPGYDVYSCNAWLVYPDGSRQLYAHDERNRPFVTMTLDDYLRGEPYLFAGGACIRRELYDQVGGFRPESYCEDVDFAARMMVNGARHIYCPEPLVLYNVGGPGQKTSNVERICDSTIEVYRRLIDCGKLTHRQLELARAAIVRVKEWRALELGRIRLRRAVTRIVGSSLADPTIAALHKITWIVRPLRRFLARWQQDCTGK